MEKSQFNKLQGTTSKLTLRISEEPISLLGAINHSENSVAKLAQRFPQFRETMKKNENWNLTDKQDLAFGTDQENHKNSFLQQKFLCNKMAKNIGIANERNSKELLTIRRNVSRRNVLQLIQKITWIDLTAFGLLKLR